MKADDVRKLHDDAADRVGGLYWEEIGDENRAHMLEFARLVMAAGAVSALSERCNCDQGPVLAHDPWCASLDERNIILCPAVKMENGQVATPLRLCARAFPHDPTIPHKFTRIALTDAELRARHAKHSRGR